MKKVFLFLATFLFLLSAAAEAGPATPFKGWYPILNQQLGANKVEHFLMDVDTMENIWAKYGEEGKPLPPDLEPYRKESSVLCGFTNRNFLILTLEKLVQVAGQAIHIDGGDSSVIEIQKMPNGQSNMATREKGVVNQYQLDVPKPVQ